MKDIDLREKVKRISNNGNKYVPLDTIVKVLDDSTPPTSWDDLDLSSLADVPENAVAVSVAVMFGDYGADGAMFLSAKDKRNTFEFRINRSRLCLVSVARPEIAPSDLTRSG